MECQALWDSFKDIKDNKFIDPNTMISIFQRRALDSKAIRKLSI